MDNQPTTYSPPTQPTQKKWYQSWRIIYPILGAVLVVELILGIKTLLASIPPVPPQKIEPISGAQIFLIASQTNYKVGDQVLLTIKVSTGGHLTSGTDLILRFDPKALEASSSSFKKGYIYGDYPLVSIDSKIGLVRISGVAQSTKQGFGGIGEFGVINFKAKKAGSTALTVDFKKNQTNDSNVIDNQDNKDVLENVTNLNIIIK